MLARTSEEPLLEACAASYAHGNGQCLFAPGVVELSWVLGAERIPHVAALSASLCSLREDDAPAEAETASVRVSGDGELRVHARAQAVHQAQALFRRARLHLMALDCEPCALRTLADVLGTGDDRNDGGRRVLAGAAATAAPAITGVAAAARRHQPLAAVSIRPDAEKAAHALGEDLAVPVGLALAWFGADRAL
ncbi:MAG TPA: hypothetical protein VEC57_05005 [Candidatus Limnocylindrales bacterium]|nr:hypothetical protein [Candidatus Limnocylindrales bacterium]